MHLVRPKSIEQVETGSFASRNPFLEQADALRVVSWNIARGCQLKAVSEFLENANADLILLQETDTNSRRTGYRNIARELSQKLRMNYVFGVEFEELSEGSHESPAYHGQATLSRWRLSEPRILRFRSQSSFWRPRWWVPPLPQFQRRIGGRMALVTQVCVGNRRLVAYNLHLESRSSDELRYLQLSELLDEVGQHDPDLLVIAGGDFNCEITRGAHASRILDSHVENPFNDVRIPTTTSNIFHRLKMIDSILVRPAIGATNPEIHNTVCGSDHYPISLTIPLTGC